MQIKVERERENERESDRSKQQICILCIRTPSHLSIFGKKVCKYMYMYVRLCSQSLQCLVLHVIIGGGPLPRYEYYAINTDLV